jgi:hypothetical protein
MGIVKDGINEIPMAENTASIYFSDLPIPPTPNKLSADVVLEYVKLFLKGFSQVADRAGHETHLHHRRIK